MKKRNHRTYGAFGCLWMLVACIGDQVPNVAPANAARVGAASGAYLVSGSVLAFGDCRARDGLIGADGGRPVVACDPRLHGMPVPAHEFGRSDSGVPQTDPA